MKKNFKSIESHFIPPGVVGNLEEFKSLVVNEIYAIMESKKEYQEAHNVEVPLPIGVFVLYKDLSVRKAMVFPDSAAEKSVMVLALKKQVKSVNIIDGKPTCTEPIYGAFTSEIFMASTMLPKGKTAADFESLKEETTRKFQSGELERVTRVLIQFEDPATRIYDCKLYEIIDPCILVPKDDESTHLSELFTEFALKGEQGGLMGSLFDISPEQEIDVLDSIGLTGAKEMDVNFYSVENAIKFVQDTLKASTVKNPIDSNSNSNIPSTDITLPE